MGVIPDTDPKYMWKDRSRTSEEFELSLEINDSDFVDTVKQEYRSSSPSWANQKFRFPVIKDKGGLNEESTESSAEEAEKEVFSNTVNVTPAEFDKDAERTISVRRRMQDEIKKEDAIKLEKVDLAKSKKIVTKRDSSDQESSTEMPVKIKGDSATRKDRQYRRGSQDELENEERRDRSASSETERRKEEKRFRDERQRERDRKDREKNNRMREEEEERKRRLKLEDLRLEDEKRMRKKREDDKERELIKERKKMEERKLADEESRRRKREEEDLLRRQDKLNEEKRKLDAEKKEIERKRAEDDRRTKEKFFAEKEASKRSRSRSDVEGGPSKKKFTGGDLRSQLNKKKEKTIITKKKTKKKKKKESSSESSSDSSSSSSDSDDSDSDVNAKLILGNPKLLKRILEAVTKTSKKKKIKKKKKKVTKSPKGEKVVPEQRRVVMAKEGGAITMQLDNQSQAEDEEDDIDLHLAKYNKKAAKILQGKRQTRDSDEVMESNKKRPKVDEDKERIQIN